MGSADILFIGTLSDGHLHVARDHHGMWWCVGSEGSYGGSKSRQSAVNIACDTSATAFHGERHIYVHNRLGLLAFIIKRVKQKASSQFFQDSVN